MPQVIDKQAVKHKAFVMRTIMGDSKLSKILTDAWKAPVGSTKNAKAKAILRSLQKTQQSYGYIMDGQGGMGKPVMTQNPLDAYIQSITKQSKPAPNPATLSSGATVPVTPVGISGSEATPAPMPTYAPTVTGAPNPTIPNITSGQVRSAFTSFGYEPDLNHMNDTGYWMTKPATDISKLINELRKRREKDNTILEERNQKVETESRLTPERIKQLYDAYGLNDEIKNDKDINKIQHALPNDESALVKILEAEQKRKLAVYKEKLSPAVKKQDGKGGAATSTQPLSDLLKSVQPSTQLGNQFFSLSSPFTPNTSSNFGLSLAGGNTLPNLSQPTSSVQGLSLTPPASTFGSATTSPFQAGLTLDPKTGSMVPGISSNTSSSNPLAGLINTDMVPKQYKLNPITGILEEVVPGTTSRPKTGGATSTTTAPATTAWDKNEADRLASQLNGSGTKKYSTLSGKVTGSITPITQSATTPLSDIESGFASGLGPTGTAIGILSNRKKLAAFLGMPESSLAEFMPLESGLLSAQLAGIYAAEAKAHGLDAAYKSMFDAANRNLSIEDNLSAYIRGKDVYLGAIDKLIDQGVDIMANSDTSNPYVAKQLGNYMTYLNVLQGRQNTRYVNMLDLAIKSNNNEYQQATNLYNAAEKKVTDDYNRVGAVTAEFYKTTTDMVKEMYANVAGRDETLQKTFDFEMKKVDAMFDTATKSLALLQKQKDLGLPVDFDALKRIYPNATDAELSSYASNMTSSTKYDKITNLDIANSLMGITTDSKTGAVTFSDYDPMSAIDAAATSQNYDPAVLFKQYEQATGKNLAQKAATGNFESELNAYGPALSNMYQVAAANPNLNNGYQSIKNTIKSGLTKGLTEFLSGKKDRLKEAINSLTGAGIFNKQVTDRAKFIAAYSDLGDVAGLLFDINVDSQGGLDSTSIVDEQFDLLVQQLVTRATSSPTK